jgi:amidohydrolase family protein
VKVRTFGLPANEIPKSRFRSIPLDLDFFSPDDDLDAGRPVEMRRRGTLPKRLFALFVLALSLWYRAGAIANAQDAKSMNFIDAHVHVWSSDTERYPLAPGFKKSDIMPASFTPEDLFRHCKPEGVGRINLIQISFYGFDNSCMLDAIAKYPQVFVGTAVIDPLGADPTQLMSDLAKEGIRAFRLRPNLTKEPIDRWLRA